VTKNVIIGTLATTKDSENKCYYAIMFLLVKDVLNVNDIIIHINMYNQILWDQF